MHDVAVKTVGGRRDDAGDDMGVGYGDARRICRWSPGNRKAGARNEADKVSLLLDGLCDSPVIFGCEWEIRHTKGYPSDNQAITKR